ncbi:hypothetical protein JAAARDRAFT_399336 [Jaapia argillacea MUCL 33604]|uniref:BBC1/AIM3 cysteine proteinase-fold domain-containing protein n=1 Tax=Jaapia argillacea MUCL 33604 TaxID=933084 RepID=A0A067PL81_9AGAM|nr:hypothetical protein JAAARDRAFT_399336 [Jaapia argillacea MUCL 33604]
MPFTVADLKQKAAKAKDASVTKFHDTKDRYSSQPAAKTTWDPNYKKPPPPPQGRSSRDSRTSLDQTDASTSSTPSLPSRGPPPVVRTNTRPTAPPPRHAPPIANRRAVTGAEEGEKIDWANLSPEDKQVFFSWLDEFFARYFNIPAPPRSTSDTAKPVVQPKPTHPQVSKPIVSQGRPPATLPPPVATWSKPKLPSPSPSPQPSNDFVMSFPPPTTHGSAALDLAQYFHPSTHWDSAWYMTDPAIPPSLQGNTNLTYRATGQISGGTKTMNFGVFFADLSVCWYTVSFPTSGNADPNNTSVVRRSAKYLPTPKALDGPSLVEAHETYGETIAAFAESFAGTGEWCGRGECWDLADQALKYFDQYDYVSKPIPSLSRTHGHLIFEGKATGGGRMVGRWRGGDDRVRRGDIVEWRKVSIGAVGGPPGAKWTLGDPDHTAIIVRDSVPSRTPVDGEPLSPAEIGSLEVVDQSVSSAPDRREFDLKTLEQGEMWIYRPIGMQEYLGFSLDQLAVCPPGLQVLTI